MTFWIWLQKHKHQNKQDYIDPKTRNSQQSRKPVEWEKIPANHIVNKELMSKNV